MQLADRKLGEAHVPIPDRAFRAACMLMELGAIRVEGKSKENFLEEAWFADIHRLAANWYRDKYGDAIERPANTITGVFLNSGVARELQIPTTLSRVEEQGESAWLIFPVDVQEEEDPMTWVVHPPNLEAMEPVERDLLRNQIVKIGTWLRSIHLDIRTAERSDRIIGGLASDVMTHLQDSAAHILQPDQTRLRLACWEAHQAAEKSLKVISRQREGKHKKWHDLGKLYKHLALSGNIPLSERLIDKLPTGQAVIKMRTNEGQEVRLLDSIRVYRAALLFVRQCTSVMPRKWSIRNSRILLKKAPFAL